MFTPPGPKFAKRRFSGSEGNVTMMFALAVPLLMLAVAAAIDLSNASVVRSRLNAAADDAALAGLTPAMMQQSDTIAQAAVDTMFAARAAEIGTLSGYTLPNVTITHPGSALTRMIQVSYTENTKTFFSQILHTTSISVGGTSTAQASAPPNIDFYLLLDNSPSMSLPSTQAGVTQMQNITPTQDGGNSCALACHQASTNNTDTMGNLCGRQEHASLSHLHGQHAGSWHDCDRTINIAAPIRTARAASTTTIRDTRPRRRLTTIRWRGGTTSPCGWTSFPPPSLRC